MATFSFTAMVASIFFLVRGSMTGSTSINRRSRFLMYLPLALFSGISKVAIFFGLVITAEAFLLRMLLRELGFDEAACLGGIALFLGATLFKSQLDFVSLSHLTN